MPDTGQNSGPQPSAAAAEKPVVILYGRAAFDRQQNLASIAARLNAAGEREFVAAYEDLTGPSLPDVLEDLMRRGVRAALVVPAAFPADPSLSAWLPGALAAWRLQHAGGDFDLRIGPPIEQFLDVAAAVEAAVAAEPERVRPVAEVKPSMGKPGWSEAPEHARQVLFCLGARCAHRKAQPLYQHMRKVMKAIRPLNSGPQRAMCVRTSCLFPCNQGPLLIVQPDGVWYGNLDEAMIERIVREHLLADKPVSEAVVHRQTARQIDPA